MRLTLDTNCIIDLESGEGCALDLEPLVEFHEKGAIDLQVPGIVASERVRAGTYLPNFAEFSARVQRLSQRAIEVLKPIGHWNITYWDEGVWANEPMVALERTISQILFPSYDYEWSGFARKKGIDPAVEPAEDNGDWRKWRNRLCDCSALWCHIYYSGDVFVTNDENFLRTKRSKLESLGAKCIRNPRDARLKVSKLHTQTRQ